MKRKINLVGNTTLTVSLPSKWVKRNNLKKGDEIILEENGGQLIIKSGAVKDKLKEIIINFDDNVNSSIAWRYLKSAYLQGYDIIIVNFSKSTVPSTSKDDTITGKKEFGTEEFIYYVASRFFAVAVFEQQGNSFVLKDIGIDSNVDVDDFGRKISSQINILADKIPSAIDSEEGGGRDNILAVENNINNLQDYGVRILNRRSRHEIVSGDRYLFLVFLEHVADRFFDIFLYVVKYKYPFTNETREYYNEVVDKYKKFHNSIWYNKKEITNVYMEVRALREKLRVAAKKNPLLSVFAQLCDEINFCNQFVLYNLCESRVIDE